MIITTGKKLLFSRSPAVEKTGGISLRIKIIFAFGAIYIIWGTTYLAIRFAISTIPPFLMMGSRFLLAGTVLYAWARFRGDANPSLRQWKTSGLIGILLFLGGAGSLGWSEQVLPSGIAAIIVATTPLWMILLSYFRSRTDQIGGRVILGLVLGFLGMVLIAEPSRLFGGQPVPLVGVAVLLVGTISWSSGSVYSKYANLPKNPLLVSGMTMLCGGTALVLVGLLTGESLVSASPSVLSLVSFFYLISFGSIAGFTAYVWLLKTVSPARVSTYAFVNPVIAVFAGWLGGGEILSQKILMAAVLMVAGVAAIVFRKAQHIHSPEKGNSENAMAFRFRLKEQDAQRLCLNARRKYVRKGSKAFCVSGTGIDAQVEKQGAQSSNCFD